MGIIGYGGQMESWILMSHDQILHRGEAPGALKYYPFSNHQELSQESDQI